MKKLIYPAILWLLCVLLGTNPFSVTALLAIVLSVSLTAVGLCLQPLPARLLCGVFGLATILWQPLFPYLPLCAYLLHHADLLEENAPFRSFRSYLWLIPLLISLPQAGSVSAFLSVIVLCLLALLLSYCAYALEQQEQRFYALQDDAIQRERSLEEKNKTLREKQDYQIQLATLSERGRLAREIHDNVGHLLTRALFQVSALQVMQPANKESLGMVKTTLEDAMVSIRASVHDLHEEALDLRLELQKLIDPFLFCPISLRYNCGSLPADIHYCFIAVVKEALSNIARHSNATAATVSVQEHPALYQLMIEDNGTSSKQNTDGSKAGIGLHNIQERVTALQGNFIIQTNSGFRIFISIPKPDVKPDSNPNLNPNSKPEKEASA